MSFRPQPSKLRKSRLERVLEVGRTLTRPGKDEGPLPFIEYSYPAVFAKGWKDTLKQNMGEVDTFDKKQVAELLKAEDDALKGVSVNKDVLLVLGENGKLLATFKNDDKTNKLLEGVIINELTIKQSSDSPPFVIEQ